MDISLPEYRFWHASVSQTEKQIVPMSQRKKLGVVATNVQHVNSLCRQLGVFVHAINHAGEVHSGYQGVGQHFWALTVQVSSDKKHLWVENINVVAPDCCTAAKLAEDTIKQRWAEHKYGVLVLSVNKKGTVDYVVVDTCAKTYLPMVE